MWLYKNFETLYREAGRSKQEFCDDVGLSVKTYDRWKLIQPNFTQQKTSGKLDDVIATLNRKIHDNCFPSLTARFPNGITRELLLGTDIHDFIDPSIEKYHYSKLVGKYFVYHLATRESNERVINYGLLEINATMQPNVFTCSAELNMEQRPASDCWITRKEDYIGTAYTCGQSVWINLVGKGNNDFVTASFELSSKIFGKNPKSPFVGARGTAMAQTTGVRCQTIIYPLIIASRPWDLSLNELQTFLTFPVNRFNEDSVLTMAGRLKKVISLLNEMENSRKEEEKIDDKISKQMIKSLLNGLLGRVYSDSAPSMCRFDESSQSELYTCFFERIKKAVEKERAEEQTDPKGDKKE